MLEGNLKTLLDVILQSVPKLAGALAVFLLGWIISGLISRSVAKILEKTGIDQLGKRLNEIDLFKKSSFEIKLSGIISKILYYTMLLIFTVGAVDLLEMEALSQLVSDLINYVPKLITAFALLLVGALLADTLSGIVKSTCASLGIPSAGIIGNLAFWLVFLTIGVSALSQAEIDTDFIRSNLTVLLGGIVLAFAIGYGLAARPTVENFLASFYSKNKFRLGDTIEIAGVKGQIVDINNTSFTIRNEDSKVIFPLSKLTTEKVIVFE